MAAILGIDAAWTVGNASGVALVSGSGSRWRCLAVAPSFLAFHGLSRLPGGLSNDGSGHASTLAAAEALANSEVDLVAVDMPMSHKPISSRREADRTISSAFGGRGCSAHSPNADRPGAVGVLLQGGFERAGYSLATAHLTGRPPKTLLEVYPHPALLALLAAGYRIPYKVSRSRRYWPAATVRERIDLLLAEYTRILDALGSKIQGIGIRLPDPDSVSSLARLKPVEDQIDALICAWVGIEHLNGRTEAFGDLDAAIWVPRGARPN